jgi:hypothetical protein
MSGDDTETPSQALRELARLVARDGVDSDHLEEYMRRLLSKHLIELHSACRYEARVVALGFTGLDAPDVAGHLCERACELEQNSAALASSASQRWRQQSVRPISIISAIRPIRARPFEVPVRWHLSLWLPQLIAAVVCIGVGVSLLLCIECDDSTLRLMAASACGLLGFIYATEGIRSAWRSAHPGGRR